MFGYGKDTQAANAKSEQQADNDAFKGFSFAKEENAASASAGGGDSGNLPAPPAPKPVSGLTNALNKA